MSHKNLHELGLVLGIQLKKILSSVDNLPGELSHMEILGRVGGNQSALLIEIVFDDVVKKSSEVTDKQLSSPKVTKAVTDILNAITKH